jgi:predicted nucleotidyltransferase
MENLNHLLKRLLESGIDFVLIGGYAAVLHGSSQVTQDIDICAVITESDLQKLRHALGDLEPKRRMNPGFQPSLADYPPSGQSLENYYLRTNSGVLDIIRNVDPVGSFERIKSSAVTVQLFGLPCKVISLDDLIAVKKAMRRPKDKATLQELEAIKEKGRT